jgi:hypothetical protein
MQQFFIHNLMLKEKQFLDSCLFGFNVETEALLVGFLLQILQII